MRQTSFRVYPCLYFFRYAGAKPVGSDFGCDCIRYGLIGPRRQSQFNVTRIPRFAFAAKERYALLLRRKFTVRSPRSGEKSPSGARQYAPKSAAGLRRQRNLIGITGLEARVYRGPVGY